MVMDIDPDVQAQIDAEAAKAKPAPPSEIDGEEFRMLKVLEKTDRSISRAQDEKKRRRKNSGKKSRCSRKCATGCSRPWLSTVSGTGGFLLSELTKCVKEAMEWFKFEFGRRPKSDDDFRWITVRAQQMEANPLRGSFLTEEEKTLNRFCCESDVVEN